MCFRGVCFLGACLLGLGATHTSVWAGESPAQPAVLLTPASPPVSQDSDPPAPNPDQELRDKYQAKLELPFVKAIGWQQSLESARKLSRENNLPIIAYFTRSYAP